MHPEFVFLFFFSFPCVWNSLLLSYFQFDSRQYLPVESHSFRCIYSLMESFVPFGGFFSAPSDLKLPLSCSHRCLPRSHQCNEKCETEVYAVPKGGFTASVAGQHQASLPSWMQVAPLGPNKGSDMKVCVTKSQSIYLQFFNIILE